MPIFDSTKKIELTKSNSIFVNDNDGHNYCIHENEGVLFLNVLEKCEEIDDYEEHEKLFPNMCGMDTNEYRKLYLK